MRLVVGLGNPGPEYADTRHNVGFRCVDLLARRFDAAWQERRRDLRSLLAVIRPDEDLTLVLAKPQTYMNLSGEAVACLLRRREGLAPDRDLLVLSDDVALPFGTIRLRARGSSGGQKGLQSIIAALRTDEFMRLRIGIRPEHPVSDTARFVLERFPTAQRAEVEKVLARGAEALRAVLRDGLDKAMSQYNS